MDKKKSRKGLVVLLLILAILIAVVPFLMLKDAEFGGSDDAAGGVGVGILAFFMGRFYERKKWMKDEKEE